MEMGQKSAVSTGSLANLTMGTGQLSSSFRRGATTQAMPMLRA